MTETKELIPLVIDRARWLRGNGMTSRLLNGAGQMCCLGFACLASGCTPGEIRDQLLPNSVTFNAPSWPADVVGSAVTLNDDPYAIDAEREHELVPVLAQLGFAVTFTGEGHP